MSNNGEEVEKNKNDEWDRAALLQSQDLDETLQSWVLERVEKSKKKRYVDFGCIVMSHKALKWILSSIFMAFLLIALPIIITKSLPKHHSPPTPPDNYTLALHKALLFFNAQKCMFFFSKFTLQLIFYLIKYLFFFPIFSHFCWIQINSTQICEDLIKNKQYLISKEIYVYIHILFYLIWNFVYI